MLSRIRKWFTRSYDGAAGGRRWRGQPEMPVQLAAALAARGPIARRARYLAGNNALAASAVEAWVSALVGTGIKPQSSHADTSTRETLNARWESWTDESDADGLGDLYAQQALMVRRMVIDGEAFGLLINTVAGLRVRLLDPEQVDPSLNREIGSGARIVQGIEFDSNGTRVAYHVRRETPGLPFGAWMVEPDRIPAEDVVHLFRPEVPGQVRGLSWFAPVMLRIANLDTWRDAQLARQQTAAMLAGFIKSAIDGTGTPMAGEADGKGNLTGGLEPGALKYLAVGEDITFSNPANIGAEVIEFAKMTEREIAVGLGLPAWILSGDIGDANYGSQRGSLIEWRRRIDAYQHGVIVFQALRPIWKRWAATEVLSGVVRTTVAAATAAKWIAPRNDWIDPLKDAQAEVIAINAGLLSRRQAVASRGVDIEALDAEIAADRERAAALGLTFTAANDNNKPAAEAA